MTFNFNYNMLCCFFFFLFFICYKHRHLAWTILDSSPLSIHASFILTPSLFLSNLVLSRRRNYKKISNHEQNGDKRPHVLQLPFITFFRSLHLFFSSICLLVRSLFLSLSLSLSLSYHPPLSIYLSVTNIGFFFFCRASRVTTNYTVTLFHYYRYITLRHYIFINSSCIHSPLYSNITLNSVNLCLNRREIARCNSSGSKGKSTWKYIVKHRTC